MNIKFYSLSRSVLTTKALSIFIIVLCMSACSQRQGPPAPVIKGTSRGDINVQNNLPSIIIKSGDTIQLLAQRYRVSPQEIIAVNNLKKPYHLRKGKKLLLPQKVMGGGNFITNGKTKLSSFPTSPPKAGQIVTVPLDDEPLSKNIDKTEKTITSQNDAESSTVTTGANEEVAKSTKFDVVDNVLATKTKAVEKTASIGAETTAATALMAEKNTSSLKTPEVKTDNTPKINQPTPLNAITISEDIAQNSDQVSVTPLDSNQTEKSKTEIDNTTVKKGSAHNFSWPIQGEIIEKFGVRSNGLRNDGINIQASEGDPIKSAGDGIVAYVGNELSGFGNLVMIRHAQSWMSAYAHCSEILVKRGNSVKSGSVIAKIGHTGSVRTPQLHFELREKMKAVDPLLYLK